MAQTRAPATYSLRIYGWQRWGIFHSIDPAALAWFFLTNNKTRQSAALNHNNVKSCYELPGVWYGDVALTDLHGLEASKTKCTENLLGLSTKGTSFKVFFFRLTAFLIVAVCVSSCGGAAG